MLLRGQQNLLHAYGKRGISLTVSARLPRAARHCNRDRTCTPELPKVLRNQKTRRQRMSRHVSCIGGLTDTVQKLFRGALPDAGTASLHAQWCTLMLAGTSVPLLSETKVRFKPKPIPKMQKKLSKQD